MKPYIIGIIGGSGSGKTTTIKKIMSSFNTQDICCISMDNYYKPKEEQFVDTDGFINFDHPDALYMDLFEKDIFKILNNEDVFIQEYIFNDPSIMPNTIHLYNAPILIIEGLFILEIPTIRNLFDLKIYIDVDEYLKLCRKIERDLAERNRSIKEILDDYTRNTVPMFRKFVEPYKDQCDIIFGNQHKHNKASEVIINHIQQILNDRH